MDEARERGHVARGTKWQTPRDPRFLAHVECPPALQARSARCRIKYFVVKKIIAPKKIYASTPVEPVWSAAWRETFSNEKKQDSNITADFPIVFLVLHFWLAA